MARSKSTDWTGIAEEVVRLIHKLQKKPFRVPYSLNPGSILNAYREGDITFKKAVAELKRWKKLSGNF